ncbi:WXG100 family type VII secretion target [Solwaraspora sp. WMMD791]|uniref:WXG100 family type VII secretion target n=1 Tax=Solwaraspora sp. WMMD791 TaxID=3016086 RepID=UPI00249AB702|nr:WXG100 family type VII secretion target [Solwaraspora sp. WMMD791]WFE25469.1 WXG100 family type VII secretion target [Solwaraspora sp. WMMD791]
MADDKIGYDYGVLLDGVSRMQGINREVEQLIQNLSRETGQALDTWSGPAAANYNELSARIERNFGDMNTIVHDLAKELKIRSDDMQQQDIRSGNRFGR